MVQFIDSVYFMFTEAAFYLLIGFGVAGILRYVLSEDRFLNWFGRDDFGSVMLASLLGVPLPLCSCSVLPVAVAMRKRGASRGAVTSFLISTPETGVDSILITYALLDPIMTVVRPVAALLTALFTGTVVNWFTRHGAFEGREGAQEGAGPEKAGAGGAGAGEPGETGPGGRMPEGGPSCSCSSGPEKTGGEGGSGGAPGGDAAAPPCHGASESGLPTGPGGGGTAGGGLPNQPVPGAAPCEDGFFRRAMHYGYVTLVDDLVSVLAFAFLCSGLIAVAVPGSLFQTPLAHGFGAMLIMLFVGIPFYICATASTPIAATLLLKGLSPGAAVVFLLAGPATNLGSLFALSKYLGKKTIAVYLACIAAATLLIGSLVDSIYQDYGVDITKTVGSVSESIPAFLKGAAAVVLLALMVRSAWKTDMLAKWGANVRSICRPLHFDPLGRAAAAVAAAAVVFFYVLTAFSVVDVGEVGWVLRFGKVTRALDRPGLVVHLPWPFEEVRTCRPEEVHTIALGFERVKPSGAGDAAPLSFRKGAEWSDMELEAEVLDGEESLVSLRYSVHYRVKDPYLYTFRNSDPAAAVKAFAASAVRSICSQRGTDRILVGHRAEMEEMTRRMIQEEADRAGVGVEILRVTYVDVHAPPSVHYAFRDVASAAEDKHKKKLEAESVRYETLAMARAKAVRVEKEAEIYQNGKISDAKGLTAAFEALVAAYREAPLLTRLRLYIEVMETVLARSGAVVPLDAGIAVDLWMDEGAARPPFAGGGPGGREGEGRGAAPRGAAGEKGKKSFADSPFRDFIWNR